MASHSRLTRPAEREVLPAQVVRSITLTPHTTRVTIGGDGLSRFRPMGFDQWFRLFIPRQGQDGLRRPAFAGLTGYLHLMTMSKDTRPIMRNYSVRAFRADPPEIDIDVLVHPGGAVSDWARRARPGEPVAILDEGIAFTPPADVEWTVLACDESGLPAVAGICASLPPDARGEAFIEVPEAADIQEITLPAGLRAHWLPRDQAGGAPGAGPGTAPGAEPGANPSAEPGAAPGELALAALTRAELPGPRTYAFVVGETGVVARARRHLLTERALPKENISFCGYWRRGR